MAPSECGPYERMEFVNKEDDLPFGVFDLIYDSFEALLEFASELCTCNERSHVQGYDSFIF